MKTIVLISCPSPVGGGQVEAGHTALLWRSLGIPVTIIPVRKHFTENPWIERLTAAGCKITPVIDPTDIPSQSWLYGRIVVDFAAERAVKLWPSMLKMGCRLVHVPCMVETTPAEANNFRHSPPTAVVFQSDYQRQRLGLQYTLFGVKPERQVLIHGAFDDSEFPYRPAEHKPGAPFVLGRIGRDVPAKWSHRLLPILSAVRERGIDVRGSFLGWTPQMAKYTGPLPEWCHANPPGAIPASVYYRDLHTLLCVGECKENWPRVVLEAMAAGVPVLADDHSGFTEMVQQGETGLLCATQEEFSHDLLRLATDEKYRLAIAKQARDALPLFTDPTAIGEKWATLFASI